MNWKQISSLEDLNSAIEESKTLQRGVLLFKHSTRCSISSTAKSRIERNWHFTATEIPAYFIDLLAFRNISNQIAEQFNIEHQSPQALLLKNGVCIYNASHFGIDVSEIESASQK